jgi:serine/threonine protein kinase
VERPCLLLEYAPGGSVKAQLQTADGEPAGMTEEQAKCVIMNVAMALRDCHSERILFRDLHPGKIVAAPGQDIYKLVDFGSAHRMVNGLGEGVCGVAHYRLPEQVEGATYADTLDTGKLGLLLLELRTGERVDGMCWHALHSCFAQHTLLQLLQALLSPLFHQQQDVCMRCNLCSLYGVLLASMPVSSILTQLQ